MSVSVLTTLEDQWESGRRERDKLSGIQQPGFTCLWLPGRSKYEEQAQQSTLTNRVSPGIVGNFFSSILISYLANVIASAAIPSVSANLGKSNVLALSSYSRSYALHTFAQGMIEGQRRKQEMRPCRGVLRTFGDGTSQVQASRSL